MITNIKIKNYKSIYKEIEMDFIKSQINYYDNYVIKNDLVNPILLYGDNASGKSCFLEVFNTINKLMTMDITNSLNMVYFDYNRYLGKHNEPIEIEITLIVKNTEYKYVVIGIDFDEIATEKLYVKGVDILNIEEEGYKYSKLRALANNGDNKHIQNVYQALSNIQFVTLHGNITTGLRVNLIDFITSNEKRINDIIASLNNMEYLIHFIVVRNVDGSKELHYKEYKVSEYNKYLKGMEKVKSNASFDDFFEKNNTPELSYDIHMSNGLKKLFLLIGFLLEVPNGSTVIIDEIENMIHPTTLIKLIETFNKLFNIQLIVSTHNTSIMKQVRPDQIFLVKLKEHNTYIKRLNNVIPKIRENQNIEKLYFDNKIWDKFSN